MGPIMCHKINNNNNYKSLWSFKIIKLCTESNKIMINVMHNLIPPPGVLVLSKDAYGHRKHSFLNLLCNKY